MSTHVLTSPNGETMTVFGGVYNVVMRYLSDPQFAAHLDSAGVGVATRARTIISKVQQGWTFASDYIGSKRQRTDTTDPLSVGTGKNKHVVGMGGIFTGGVPPQPSTTMRLAKSVFFDNMPWLINQLNRTQTMRSQAELQIIGDSEQRSVQMFTYRHRCISSDITTSRVLNPVNASGQWYPMVDGTAISNTGVYSLDLNQGPTAQYYNGKCFYAPLNIADLENQSFAMVAPFFNQSITPISTTSSFAGIDPAGASNFTAGHMAHRVSPYWAQYTADGESSVTGLVGNSYNRPLVSPTVVDGGVKLSFSNKGPSGAFVEILVIKKKQNGPDITVGNVANTYDQPLLAYSDAIGKGQLVMKSNNQGVIDLGGDTPNVDHYMTSPYHKLLPESKFSKKTDVDFSQKERFKFALPSAGKKTVTIRFGGFNGIGNNIGVGDKFCPETVSILIAINGQIQSAEFSKATDQLVSGNVCSPHNVMVFTDYYETVQAARQSPPPKNAYVRGRVNPELYTGTLPSGVTAHPFQMIAAEKIVREGQGNGRRQHAMDGDLNKDEL